MSNSIHKSATIQVMDEKYRKAVDPDKEVKEILEEKIELAEEYSLKQLDEEGIQNY